MTVLEELRNQANIHLAEASCSKNRRIWLLIQLPEGVCFKSKAQTTAAIHYYSQTYLLALERGILFIINVFKEI